jgi:cobalt/nickel transport system permease protein
MVIPHMLVASVVEGLLTALVIIYLQTTNQAVLQSSVPSTTTSSVPGLAGVHARRFVVLLVILIVATPLGLLAPGTAWGEWSGAELAKMGLPSIPEGMARLEGLWGAPMARYNLPALKNAGMGYVLSAVLGVALVALVVWLVTLALTARGRARSAASEGSSSSVQTRLPGLPGGRKQTRVVQRTLAGIAGTLDTSLFAESVARHPGLLQSIDARVKLIACLLLLLAVSLSRSLPVIVAVYALALILAWRSAIPMRHFVGRVWLFMPFFTGLIALPALFAVPGPALVHLPFGLTITQPGATSAAFLLLRVGTSVSVGVLLVLTTPWNSLLKALASLRVPDTFLVILGMTYRYIYLLLHSATDMMLSRQSRTVGRQSDGDERRMVAASTGVLLSRSLQLSGDVYLAMQARGFRGQPRTMDTFRLQRRDWLYGGAALLASGLAIWLGR